MHLLNKIKILFLLLLLNTAIYAQWDDAGMWNTFSIEKGITKKFSIALDEELRLRENFTQLNLLYTNLGVNYKLFKFLKTLFLLN